VLGTLLLAGCSNASRDGTRAAEAAGGPTAADGGESVARTAACPPPADAGAVNTAYDVAYAVRGGDTLRFDVAWPRTPGPHAVVVLLHGGGWEGGSRASLHDEMLALARLGYAAATVSYRLTSAGRNVFPAAVADVRCAVRVLRARAGEYGVDPRRIAAAGFSAGAHLASMLGAAGDVEGLDGDCPAGGDAGVSAVVSYAGPQDLRVRGPYTDEQARLVTNFLGVFPGDDPARAALASPIVHAGRGDAPFLLIHGTDDGLVPLDHSHRMAAALRQSGTPASVLELPGTGHQFVGLATSDRAAVRCTTMSFLARWLTSE
jgi:acetyl esterase/lipase